MRKLFVVAAGLVLGVAGGGCDAIGYFGYLVAPEPPGKKVLAEYPHLAGHKLAVVVRTRMATDWEDPELAGDLARRIQESISQGVPKMRFVSQEQIRVFKSKNLHWATMEEVEVGKKFDADMVLYVDVFHYALTRQGHVHYQQGRLTCRCDLFDLSQPRGSQRVWYKPDLTVEFPAKGYAGGVSTKPEVTRRQVLLLFAEKLTDCFRTHWEPADG